MTGLHLQNDPNMFGRVPDPPEYEVSEQECNRCKHHEEEYRNGMWFVSCDTWACNYEPKEEET